MKSVRVDPEKCEGHNRCYLLCPEVFDVDDEGYAFVRDDADLDAHEHKIGMAARNCPERAIQVVD